MSFIKTPKIKDVDSNENIEKDAPLPWASDSSASYLYYDCTIGVLLDSGIAVHNRLPQVNNLPDTLASVYFNDPKLDKVINRGVNLKSMDSYQDIIQRMAHSRYYFRIWGQALRVGYQVPIPGIKTIGGVPAIPYDDIPQVAHNSIVPNGNMGGLILWRAQWSLWYTTAVPPKSNNIPAAEPAALIDSTITIPKNIASPMTNVDDNSVSRTGLSGITTTKTPGTANNKTIPKILGD